MKYSIRKIKEKFLRFNCFLVCTINGGIFKTALTSVRQRTGKQWAIYTVGQKIKRFKMCTTWVTNNIWQFLLQLPPTPPHAKSILATTMSTYLSGWVHTYTIKRLDHWNKMRNPRCKPWMLSIYTWKTTPWGI